MKQIETSEAPKAVGPYSQAIISGNFIFCAGQIALDPKTGELVGKDVKSQTTQALKNIQSVLESAESSLNQVVKTTCYLKNIKDFAEFNEVYGTFFVNTKPARTTIEVSNLPRNALVEIECIAELPHN